MLVKVIVSILLPSSYQAFCDIPLTTLLSSCDFTSWTFLLEDSDFISHVPSLGRRNSSCGRIQGAPPFLPITALDFILKTCACPLFTYFNVNRSNTIVFSVPNANKQASQHLGMGFLIG
ncbi:hypothetical protein P153DRAFT_122288 [Dothidotthia symphoricarpi CBS 119687]|uniref:Secreted protein n=1 Tax=Dothidotthia symphoricarpi CBS 119687 TaxID=1392245 RepID=A0A6A6A2R1_9PLEO|nr:uncharacterized protein P153DRAFT_122288 [Dothidotthia symphoricarpi CBS 119687]KAF2125187.1 hypothetical protein P153DRAFT_122288 [Dothidotthia symphoricarpi CBS 119687]